MRFFGWNSYLPQVDTPDDGLLSAVFLYFLVGLVVSGTRFLSGEGLLNNPNESIVL